MIAIPLAGCCAASRLGYRLRTSTPPSRPRTWCSSCKYWSGCTRAQLSTALPCAAYPQRRAHTELDRRQLVGDFPRLLGTVWWGPREFWMQAARVTAILVADWHSVRPVGTRAKQMIQNGTAAAAVRAVLQEYGVRSVFALDRKSTRLNSSHLTGSRMPSSA